MIARLLMCCALLTCGSAYARPLVIESHKQLPFTAGWVALNSNQLLATEIMADSSSGTTYYTYWANLRTRNTSGNWPVTQVLATQVTTDYFQRLHVAMNESIAAIFMPDGLHIYERTSSGWVESAIDLPVRPMGNVVDVDGSSVYVTESAQCSTRAIELRRGVNGHWALHTTLVGIGGRCISALDANGDRLIFRQQDLNFTASSARIFERSGSNWTLVSRFTGSEASSQDYGQAIAIRGSLALVSGGDRGAYVYRRGPSGWAQDGFFPNPDAGEFGGDGSIQITDTYIVRAGSNINRFATIALVYRQLPDQTFEHLVNLVGDRENNVSLGFISGNRYIALTGDNGQQLLEFEIPTTFATPPLVQYDFESGSSVGPWTPLAGAQFSVVSNGTTRVYRHPNVFGDAGAIHSADMTNQTIGADIRPAAFNANGWVGLMTRYVDSSNYYYVMLDDVMNQVLLFRKIDGVDTHLASGALNVAPFQTYHLRLDSSGTHHGVFVDGVKTLGSFDNELAHGRTGLRLYNAAGDFDNVVVSPGPTSEQVYAFRETSGGNWTGNPINFTQSASTVTARRTTGWPRVDQSVQATISVNGFSGIGSPWVGLLARYVDEGNYYYVTLRKSNQLALKKLTNGVITELATVPFNVVRSQPYLLRLEAIGDRLRVYVNGVLKIERAGAQIVAGKVGVMTYRASANFGQYTAYEP